VRQRRDIYSRSVNFKQVGGSDVRSTPRCVCCACGYLYIAPAEVAKVPECTGEERLQPDLFEVSDVDGTWLRGTYIVKECTGSFEEVNVLVYLCLRARGEWWRTKCERVSSGCRL